MNIYTRPNFVNIKTRDVKLILETSRFNMGFSQAIVEYSLVYMKLCIFYK